MTIAARIIGTYSRVSRGSRAAFADSFQKSVRLPRFIARCTRPGPPLYDASTRCQSPSNMLASVERYLAAAAVAFSGSDRSSMYQSWRRPFSTPLSRMNCHTPFAFERDSALGLKALSMSGTYARSSGNPSALNHREVLGAARHPFLDEVMETALEQLDVREDLLILGNGNVVRDRLQVGLDPVLQFRRRRRLREGVRDCQQF